MSDLFVSLVAIGQVGDIGDKPVPGTTPQKKKTFSAGRRLMASTYPPSSLLTGLVSYWKFNGSSIDSLGANNGVDTDMTYSSGKLASGATFNGSTSGIDLTNPVPFRAANFTLAGWFKANAHVSNNEIFEVYDQSLGFDSTSGYEFRQRNSDGKLNFEIGLGGFNGATALTNGVWYFLTLTSTPGYTALYVNNILDGSTTNLFTYRSITRARIGVNEWAPGFRMFSLDGQLDEFGYWNRVLTAPEITTLYNGGTGLSYPF